MQGASKGLKQRNDPFDGAEGDARLKAGDPHEETSEWGIETPGGGNAKGEKSMDHTGFFSML